ncbi:MAG: transcription elongation protein SprT [Sphingopyxis macrogoltabida]|uniref:Transcription elongation protein SprT n=1 Tax=Sphingopyxis macrogoltabida TaxID=33050 RepID=A0A2W5L353_SPHMC|nr:MAG: transcription elongation protein SprT [Sphingopyxis macrogoltabida]
MNRETWLNELAALMAPRFEELGYPLPRFRVAVGWTSAGKSTRVAGECWHSSASADATFEILIAPLIDESMAIAGTLAHELTHAAVGFQHKHNGPFAKVCLALGLRRPMTATTPGPAFIEWAQPFIDQLGPIPHARIDLAPAPRPVRPGADNDNEGATEDAPEFGSSNAKPKQSARLLKAICLSDREGESCGYTVRITKKWVNELGAPCCPVHGPMTMEEGNDA